MKCHKKRFETKALAKKFKKEYNKTHSEIKLTNAYYCDGCIGYHLTSMDVEASRRLTRFKNKTNDGENRNNSL